jgi:galactose-1-phosphate uridylyltransferase
VKKFMVGFEMLGSPQRDISAEVAAERLRSVGEGLRGSGQGSVVSGQ